MIIIFKISIDFFITSYYAFNICRVVGNVLFFKVTYSFLTNFTEGCLILVISLKNKHFGSVDFLLLYFINISAAIHLIFFLLPSLNLNFFLLEFENQIRFATCLLLKLHFFLSIVLAATFALSYFYYQSMHILAKS